MDDWGYPNDLRIPEFSIILEVIPSGLMMFHEHIANT